MRLCPLLDSIACLQLPTDDARCSALCLQGGSDNAHTNCHALGYDSGQYVARANAYFAMLGAAGVSLLVSSGDTGAQGFAFNCPLDGADAHTPWGATRGLCADMAPREDAGPQQRAKAGAAAGGGTSRAGGGRRALSSSPIAGAATAAAGAQPAAPPPQCGCFASGLRLRSGSKARALRPPSCSLLVISPC